MGDDALHVYISSVSSNMQMKTKQQKITTILQSKKIAFETIDIAVSEDAKKKMRELAGDEKALPPHLARGDKYLGDFDAFELAVEDEELEKFLCIQ